MTTYFALVKAGIVQNVIAADAAFIAEAGDALADGGEWFDVSAEQSRPGIGEEFNGRGVLFVKPEPEPEAEQEPPAVQDAPGL